MPTPDIFDFDPDRLAHYDEVRLAELLAEQPALYVNHLLMAKHLDQWREGLEQDRDADASGQDFTGGYVQALRELAAHLRQGDYVVGGVMLANALPQARKRTDPKVANTSERSVSPVPPQVAPRDPDDWNPLTVRF